MNVRPRIDCARRRLGRQPAGFRMRIGEMDVDRRAFRQCAAIGQYERRNLPERIQLQQPVVRALFFPPRRLHDLERRADDRQRGFHRRRARSVDAIERVHGQLAARAAAWVAASSASFARAFATDGRALTRPT